MELQNEFKWNHFYALCAMLIYLLNGIFFKNNFFFVVQNFARVTDGCHRVGLVNLHLDDGVVVVTLTRSRNLQTFFAVKLTFLP